MNENKDFKDIKVGTSVTCSHKGKGVVKKLCYAPAGTSLQEELKQGYPYRFEILFEDKTTEYYVLCVDEFIREYKESDSQFAPTIVGTLSFKI